MNEELSIQQDTIFAVERIQNFDPETLINQEVLGQKFAFHGAVDPAKRLKGIFLKLPKEALNEFPENELNILRKQSQNVFNIFTQILEFDPEQPEASSRKEKLIADLKNQYQPVFSTLFPIISYAVARTVDFNQLAADGRAAVQEVRDEASSVMNELDETSNKAQAVLEDVRNAAAEQGVTQEARYFSEEATEHKESARKWLIASVGVAILVFAYSIVTLFFRKIPVLQADNLPEALQMTASKLLIFLVLGFALIQCVRNYSAHRHNAVSNKHRQNSLMTYTTLAEAGHSSEARDAVLQHAAAAVYSPGDSGYVKNEDRGYTGNPVVGLAPRSLVGSVTSGEPNA